VAPVGIGKEAELGQIGGVEADIIVAEEEARLANPDGCERFYKELNLGIFLSKQ